MKIYNYIDDGERSELTIIYKNNTCNKVNIISKNRQKDDILKDAYILSKALPKEEFKGNSELIEEYELPRPVETNMEVDFYNLTGKVYDQYGDIINKTIEFKVDGTEKARIENNKLVTEEVDKETSFFIVAKCGDLIQKEERYLYPKPKEEPRPQISETEKLELKIKAIEEQGAFRDDLIQEMATIVYGSLETIPPEATNTDSPTT
ncbi:hypothetical protein KQI68_06510 [Peptoniphilus sp. MSJ-1]|uniref:Uncharacterized protein n=1 Tax=Peptoniphilus ovalis TaxID=2841503 RepID=A0ABS6FH54_9FIRM|nr:hypothetical protein [Peptoniphilus ovalis]MBU5669489.1 hypothetical protein [Peptoniphilus ovalis]